MGAGPRNCWIPIFMGMTIGGLGARYLTYSTGAGKGCHPPIDQPAIPSDAKRTSYQTHTSTADRRMRISRWDTMQSIDRSRRADTVSARSSEARLSRRIGASATTYDPKLVLMPSGAVKTFPMKLCDIGD